MKIETNYIDNRIAFKEIAQGQVFMYRGEYYIKTEPIHMPSSRDKYMNAVKLRNGANGYCFSEHVVVTKINAKVVIEE